MNKVSTVFIFPILNGMNKGQKRGVSQPEALEFNKELKFKLFNNGFVEKVTGRVHYINFEQQKLHVNENTIYINMNNIIGVTYND